MIKSLLKLLFIGVISWAVTLLFVYLIMFCFKLTFTILFATGVWLCLLLFNLSIGDKKK